MASLATATCDVPLPPDGDAPAWVHLLPAGRVRTRDGRDFDLVDQAAVIATFRANRIDLPVDYEHQNDNPDAKARGPVPAAGWIKELKADDSGIWGRVEWTATAREMIAAKEYRYVSPSIIYDRDTRRIMRLKGAGLVHNPNLFLTALNSQETPVKAPSGKDDMTRPAPDPAGITPAAFAAMVAAMLGVPADTPPAELMAKLRERMGGEPDPAKFMPVAAVQSMLSDRMQERHAVATERAERKVEAAFRDGFLSRAMKPWALALCRSDEASFDSFIGSTAPAFAKLSTELMRSGPPLAERGGDDATDLERDICAQLDIPLASLRR